MMAGKELSSQAHEITMRQLQRLSKIKETKYAERKADIDDDILEVRDRLSSIQTVQEIKL